MKVYVMTDMEGVAGVIDSPNYCFPESRYYERGCELTTWKSTPPSRARWQPAPRIFS